MGGGIDRRRFMVAAGSTTGLAMTAGLGPGLRDLEAEGPRAQPGAASGAVARIDGLGEVRADYGEDVLQPMIDSGLAVVHVTLGNPALLGNEALRDVVDATGAMQAHIRAMPLLQWIGRSEQIDTIVGSGRLGLIFGLQNGAPIGASPERVERLHALGVRIVQLTYNRRNLLGDGCLERSNARLSHVGVEVVERMNALGMLVDLSHCGPATEADAVAVSSKPPAVTHSGCMALHRHPRNKTDEQLRALADAGGVFGVYQLNPNLGPRERNTLEDYLDHIAHAVRVCGIEHVGIGSDREHRTIPDTPEQQERLRAELSRLGPRTSAGFRWPFFLSELNHPRRMETIAMGLAGRGFAGAAIDRILGGNWQRLYREVIG